MLVLLLCFAIAISIFINFKLERIWAKFLVGALSGFFGSIFLGLTLAFILELTGSPQIGKNIGWTGLVSSLGTSIATIVSLAIIMLFSRGKNNEQHIQKVVITNKLEINNNEAVKSTVENKKIDENKIYEKISEEIDSSTIDKGLWLKLLAEGDGNIDKAKIQYIKERFEILKTKEIESFQLAIKKQEDTERKIPANPDLVRAVWSGDVSKTRHLLNSGIKPIGVDEQNNLLLEIARQNKDKIMTDLLNLYRAKINLAY